MNRFKIMYMNDRFSNIKTQNNKQISNYNNYFNKNMTYYVCSYGGSGSTILFNYLSNFGKVYHIHDRYPPTKLKYIGKENTDEDVYSEWFNKIEIPQDKLKNYKVIFIYRDPIKAIFSRFALQNGPHITHLQHIMCDNNGNIPLLNVIKSRSDLYKLEEFYDNYTIPKERNYDIYAVKYEQFWDNISLFNKIIDIPDIKWLYPIRQERRKREFYINELSYIYVSLFQKMRKMKFIEIIQPLDNNVDDSNNIELI